MIASERLEKYMSAREKISKMFLENSSLLPMCVQMIGDIERDIRATRKELGLPEWGYK